MLHICPPDGAFMLMQRYLRNEQVGGLFLVDDSSSGDESEDGQQQSSPPEKIIDFCDLLPGRIYSHEPAALRSVQQELTHLQQSREDEMALALLHHLQKVEPDEVRNKIPCACIHIFVLLF